jgi:hypothetical protein
MTDQRVREIYSRDGQRRVVICRRGSGTFYYAEERYHHEPYVGDGWWPERGDADVGVYESVETAAREARANIHWLITEAGSASRAEPGV